MSQTIQSISTSSWRDALNSQSVIRITSALRQISSQREVIGLAPLVVSLVAHSDEEVRMWASQALETGVRPTIDEVGQLTVILNQSLSDEVGYWAATLLGRLGIQASSAVETLVRCAADSKYLPARERAVWALAQIGRAAAPGTPTLRILAEEGPPRLKRLAIAALEAIRGFAA